jgi:hypothetical protein
MSQVIDLDRFATRGEAAVVKRLVRIVLERGYMVSINDGEEWTVTLSTDRNEILSALATTGEDIVRLYKDGERAGSLWLVYGNAEDGSELIADHTDNDACLSICWDLYPD